MPVERRLARENYDRWQYIQNNGHLDFTHKADRCEDYFAGQQWDERIRKKLESQGKPVLTINKTLATMATIFGEQIESRADITFKQFRNGNPETASALDKVYLQIANVNKLDWRESEVGADGFITSRGFYDVRMSFSDNMQGEVEITVPNPKNVGIDPDAEDYDPDTWKDVCVTKWLTPTDIATLYNEKDAKYLEEKQGSDYPTSWDSIERDVIGGHEGMPDDQSNQDPKHRRIRVIERQHKKLRNAPHFVDMATGATRPVPSTWDDDRIAFAKERFGLSVIPRIAEQIRWTVTADDVVLHDDWSPYRYFTIVPFFPFFRRGRTIGIVEHLLSPQDLLNKTLSQELHVVNTTANSGWKIKAGSLQNMDAEELEARGAETGLVLELNNPADAEKIQPNSVPTGLDRISFKADEYMKDVSGVSDSLRGFDRADVAAKAIQAKQAAGSINLAKPFDNLARTRHLLAHRVLNLVQTYYTEERTIQVTGTGLGAETEEITLNQITPEGDIINDLTAGEYNVVVTPAPTRRTQQEGQFQQALEMRQLGVNIPDDVLIENSGMDRKAEIAERVRELNGGAEPTETEQQMAELEMQLKQVEVQEKQAESQLKIANAKLAEARAANTLDEMQRPEDNGEEAKAVELEMRWREKQAELALRREEIQANLALKREEMEREHQRKREQMQMDMALKRRQAMQQQARPAQEASSGG